ncbi:MAG: hypothetical protein GDA36_06095 [Rhodobacteraceae bacterium]|nr:hypothetical protein [Paracoccaceae bacterium]
MATVAADMMLTDVSGMYKYDKIIPLLPNGAFLPVQQKAADLKQSYGAT